jgi:hypothetical protein
LIVAPAEPPEPVEPFSALEQPAVRPAVPATAVAAAEVRKRRLVSCVVTPAL